MIKLLKNLSKKEWLYFLFSVVLVVLQVWLDLKLPDYMSNIARLITTNGTVFQVLEQGLYMLSCAFGSLILAFIVGYFASYIGTSFAKKVRATVFNKIEDFGMGEIKNFSTSSLITRTTNDVTQVQMLIAMGLQAIIKAPILAIWAILKIVNKNFEWSTITGGAVFLLLLLVVIIIVFALPKFKKIQKLTDNLNKIIIENLTGIKVVKSFNAENYQQNKFNEANTLLTKTDLYVQRIMSLMSPFMSFLMPVLTLCIYFIGSYLINDATMPDKFILFSDMIVFSSYSMQIIMAFMMLIMIFIIYPRASVSAKRILEVLETKVSIVDGSKKNNSSQKGTIEFKKVSFKYPDALEYMLKDISLKINKGETVAFIGSTGSGKSTLINLIPRFYDVTEGEILVDGINVKDYKLTDLYDKLGYISQKAVLFNGTVKENIAYGDKIIKEEDMKKAIDVAQGTEFVLKMEKQYDSHIAQSGTNISGGQKQRLSIARAIARNPEIYLFDDSFSALDYKTDSILRKELKNHTKDATILIVAQRIGTIKNADKIVVLDDGIIVGDGTHKELLNSCEVYKEIAYSQLSKEELENE